MLSTRRFSLAAAILAVALASQPAVAGLQSEPVSCWIENLSPQVSLGAQASYIVHLAGGFGSYAVTFSFGDGANDYRSVSGPQTSFAHLFQATGSYVQTAHVSGAGSSSSCTSSTSVY